MPFKSLCLALNDVRCDKRGHVYDASLRGSPSMKSSLSHAFSIHAADHDLMVDG